MLRQGVNTAHREAAVKCITLDLTGTVLRINYDPATTYRKAVEWGISMAGNSSTPPLAPPPSIAALRNAFPSAYKAGLRDFPCFGHSAGLSGRRWWEYVIRRCLSDCGCVYPEVVFQRIFTRIYQRYAEPQSHSVYSDVAGLLEWAKEKGIMLGVITNNLNRAVDTTLPMLGVAEGFAFFTVACEVGSMKPAQAIFDRAAAAASTIDPTIAPSNILHIGDHYHGDYLAARTAGFKALFLEREIEHPQTSSNTGRDPFPGDADCAKGAFRVQRLDQVPQLLQVV